MEGKDQPLLSPCFLSKRDGQYDFMVPALCNPPPLSPRPHAQRDTENHFLRHGPHLPPIPEVCRFNYSNIENRNYYFFLMCFKILARILSSLKTRRNGSLPFPLRKQGEQCPLLRLLRPQCR